MLDAKALLGAMIAAMPKATAYNNLSGRKKDTQSSAPEQRGETRQSAYNEMGISRKEAALYQKMAEHPEAVENAKTLARENNDIVTASLVDSIMRNESKQVQIETAKKDVIAQTVADTEQNKPRVVKMDCLDFIARCEPYDLLLTDPPYSTDVEDITAFVDRWLYPALERNRPDFPKRDRSLLRGDPAFLCCLHQTGIILLLGWYQQE